MCARKWSAHTMDSSAPQTLGGRGHRYAVVSVAWSRNGNMIASGEVDCSIIIWNAVDKKLLNQFDGGPYVAWSPVADVLACWSWNDEIIKIWNPITSTLIHNLFAITVVGGVQSVAWSPDGKHLACAFHMGPYMRPTRVKLWDTSTWTKKSVSIGLENSISIGLSEYGSNVAWSLSGDVLACGAERDSICLWDTSTQERERSTLSGHLSEVNCVAWTRDNILASGSLDKTIKIWNTVTKTCLQTLTGHSKSVLSVSFNPGSVFLASSSNDDTIKIWNYVDGVLFRTLKLSDPKLKPWYSHVSFRSVAWSPTGSILVGGGADGIVRLWHLYSKRNWIKRILNGKDGGGIPQLNPDVVGRIGNMVVGIDPDSNASARFNLLLV